MEKQFATFDGHILRKKTLQILIVDNVQSVPARFEFLALDHTQLFEEIQWDDRKRTHHFQWALDHLDVREEIFQFFHHIVWNRKEGKQTRETHVSWNNKLIAVRLGWRIHRFDSDHSTHVRLDFEFESTAIRWCGCSRDTAAPPQCCQCCPANIPFCICLRICYRIDCHFRHPDNDSMDNPADISQGTVWTVCSANSIQHWRWPVATHSGIREPECNDDFHVETYLPDIFARIDDPCSRRCCSDGRLYIHLDYLVCTPDTIRRSIHPFPYTIDFHNARDTLRNGKMRITKMAMKWAGIKTINVHTDLTILTVPTQSLLWINRRNRAFDTIGQILLHFATTAVHFLSGRTNRTLIPRFVLRKEVLLALRIDCNPRPIDGIDETQQRILFNTYGTSRNLCQRLQTDFLRKF